jgi:hypothetical protein
MTFRDRGDLFGRIYIFQIWHKRHQRSRQW